MTFNTHVTIRIGLTILQGSSFTLLFFFFALPCTLKLRFVSFQQLGTVLNSYCVVEHQHTLKFDRNLGGIIKRHFIIFTLVFLDADKL